MIGFHFPGVYARWGLILVRSVIKVYLHITIYQINWDMKSTFNDIFRGEKKMIEFHFPGVYEMGTDSCQKCDKNVSPYHHLSNELRHEKDFQRYF